MGRPSNIIISSIKRNQRFRGPTSSEQQNDFQSEVVRDFTALQQEWNNKLVPLTAKLPDGSDDSAVNAFSNGLDGQTIYVAFNATSLLAEGRFYNTTRDRPNTVFEEFINVFSYIDAQVLTLEDLILNSAAPGNITVSQKTRIGDNIFDNSLASISSSLDGRTIIHTGNILQIARDMYGTSSPTLNSNGAAILNNSIRAMVDALLELHNGNWDNDIGLTHAAVSASDITTGTMAQARIGPSSADPGGADDTFAGTPTGLREDLNQLRRLVRETKGTSVFTGAITPNGTWSPVSPQPTHFSNLISLKGSTVRSTTNPWGYSYQDIPDLITVLGNVRDFTGQDAIGDITPTYSSVNGFTSGDSLTTAISALALNLTGTQNSVLTVSGNLNNHIADIGNPHDTTLAQVATQGGTAPADQITLVDSGMYFTSGTVEDVLQELAIEDIALNANIANVSGLLIAHSGNFTNSHNVTLTQASSAGGTAPAVQIDVADIGNYFTTATVEGALQEIGLVLPSARFTNSGLTITSTDSCLYADASVSGLLILLPDPTSLPRGRLLTVKKTDTSLNSVTISGVLSELIDGELRIDLTNKNDSITLQPTASGYFVIANYSLGEERTVIKPNDTIKDNDNTLAADPDLQIAIVSGIYLIDATLRITVASDNPGLQLNFTTVSETGIVYMSTFLTKSQPTLIVGRVFDDGNYSNSGAGSGTEYAVELRGTIEFSSSEIFTCKWAQVTSHADDVTFKRGSNITVKRLR